jgi:aryl-alcohol dehydrogenase-like predicted oxidoreductase
VDDAESVRALRLAYELGVTFFDTADTYGCGHAERIVGRALGPVRDRVVIATKFGRVFDEDTRMQLGSSADPAFIRDACAASLRRLGTDWIDLYLFHLGRWPVDEIGPVVETLDELVADGVVRAYGWSCDDAERARAFGIGAGFAAVEHSLNVFDRNDDFLRVCDDLDLASIARNPLRMGLLTGKFDRDTTFATDDVRSHELELRDGRDSELLRRLELVRDALTADGRTLAQGALAWIWAHHPRTIPIPGCRTEAQVRENAAAIASGPLPPARVAEIDEVLGLAPASA